MHLGSLWRWMERLRSLILLLSRMRGRRAEPEPRHLQLLHLQKALQDKQVVPLDEHPPGAALAPQGQGAVEQQGA